MALDWRIAWAPRMCGIGAWSAARGVVVCEAARCEMVRRPAAALDAALGARRADSRAGMEADGRAELVNKLCRRCLSSLLVMSDVELS